MKSKGKVILGKAQKTGGLLKFYSEVDFVLIFQVEIWTSLKLDQKRALVNHELCHCGRGESEWTIKGHDLEEFRQIIERHGFWHKEAQRFAESAQFKLWGQQEEKKKAVS